jgi:hypothetical protein
MRPALVIAGMIKDNVGTDKHYKITGEAEEFLPSLKSFIECARTGNFPVIHANDSFLKGDTGSASRNRKR